MPKNTVNKEEEKNKKEQEERDRREAELNEIRKTEESMGMLWGEEHAGDMSKFDSLQAYMDWHEKLPRRNVAGRDEPEYRLNSRYIDNKELHKKLRENGWVVQGDEELLDALYGFYNKVTASRENRSRRFPELECFLADMVHFKADTMENRKKLLDMAEQLAENAVKQDRKYNGYLFETYKTDRLRSAIYHARNAVTTQEELETEKVLYAEDGEVKQQVEERRRDRARAVWNDSMPGWRRNPLYEMKEDSFMDRCREWGLRTPEQQDIMQKLYRAAVLDGADSNLQREILNLPANQMMTEDSSDRDGFEQRDYLRAVKEKIVGLGLDKMANYREFLNAADAWLSRYAEKDAAAYQRRMADSPQDFERWYLYGEGMKKLPEEYLGSEGLENFIKKAKENGWTREGDEQLLMDFYTDCMTVTGGTAERGRAALAQLLQTDGSDVEQRRKALKIVDTIEDMGIGVNCIRHLFYAGTAVDEKLPVTGLDSLPIENHRKTAHSLEKAMRETGALEEEQYRERSERRRRQEQIIVQKPVPEGKGNAAESRKALEERVRREVSARVLEEYRFYSAGSLQLWMNQQEQPPYTFPSEMDGEKGAELFADRMRANGWKEPGDRELLKNFFLLMRDGSETGTEMNALGRNVICALLQEKADTPESRTRLAVFMEDCAKLSAALDATYDCMGELFYPQDAGIADYTVAEDVAQKFSDIASNGPEPVQTKPADIQKLIDQEVERILVPELEKRQKEEREAREKAMAEKRRAVEEERQRREEAVARQREEIVKRKQQRQEEERLLGQQRQEEERLRREQNRRKRMEESSQQNTAKSAEEDTLLADVKADDEKNRELKKRFLTSMIRQGWSSPEDVRFNSVMFEAFVNDMGKEPHLTKPSEGIEDYYNHHKDDTTPEGIHATRVILDRVRKFFEDKPKKNLSISERDAKAEVEQYLAKYSELDKDYDKQQHDRIERQRREMAEQQEQVRKQLEEIERQKEKMRREEEQRELDEKKRIEEQKKQEEETQKKREDEERRRKEEEEKEEKEKQKKLEEQETRRQEGLKLLKAEADRIEREKEDARILAEMQENILLRQAELSTLEEKQGLLKGSEKEENGKAADELRNEIGGLEKAIREEEIRQRKENHKDLPDDMKRDDFLKAAYDKGFSEQEDGLFLKSAYLAYQQMKRDHLPGEAQMRARLGDMISYTADTKEKRGDAIANVMSALDQEVVKKNSQCFRALTRGTEWQNTVLGKQLPMPQAPVEEEEIKQPVQFKTEAQFPEKRADLLELFYQNGWDRERDAQMLNEMVSIYNCALERVVTFNNHDAHYIDTVEKMREQFNRMASENMLDAEEREQQAEELRAAADGMKHSSIYRNQFNRMEQSLKDWYQREYTDRFEKTFHMDAKAFLENCERQGYISDGERELAVSLYQAYQAAKESVIVSGNRGSDLVEYTDELGSVLQRMASQPAGTVDGRRQLADDLGSLFADQHEFDQKLQATVKKAVNDFVQRQDDMESEKLFAGNKKAFLEKAAENGWDITPKSPERAVLVQLLQAYQAAERLENRNNVPECAEKAEEGLRPVLNAIATIKLSGTEAKAELMQSAMKACNAAYYAAGRGVMDERLEQARDAVYLWRTEVAGQNARMPKKKEKAAEVQQPAIHEDIEPKVAPEFAADAQKFMAQAYANGWDEAGERRILKNLYGLYRSVQGEINKNAENNVYSGQKLLEQRDGLIVILNRIAMQENQDDDVREKTMQDAAVLASRIDLKNKNAYSDQLRDAVSVRASYFEHQRAEKRRLAEEERDRRIAQERMERLEREEKERAAQLAEETRIAQERREEEERKFRQEEERRAREAKEHEDRVNALNGDPSMPQKVAEPQGTGLQNMGTAEKFQDKLSYVKWLDHVIVKNGRGMRESTYQPADGQKLKNKMTENGWVCEEDAALRHFIDLFAGQPSAYTGFPELTALAADLANYKADTYERRRHMLDLVETVLETGRNGFYYTEEIKRGPEDSPEAYRLQEHKVGGEAKLQSGDFEMLYYALAMSRNAVRSEEEFKQRREEAQQQKQRSDEMAMELKAGSKADPLLYTPEAEFLQDAVGWGHFGNTHKNILRQLYRSAAESHAPAALQTVIRKYPKFGSLSGYDFENNFRFYISGVKAEIDKLPQEQQAVFASAIGLMDRYDEDIAKERREITGTVQEIQSVEKERTNRERQRMSAEKKRVLAAAEERKRRESREREEARRREKEEELRTGSNRFGRYVKDYTEWMEIEPERAADLQKTFAQEMSGADGFVKKMQGAGFNRVGDEQMLRDFYEKICQNPKLDQDSDFAKIQKTILADMTGQDLNDRKTRRQMLTLMRDMVNVAQKEDTWSNEIAGGGYLGYEEKEVTYTTFRKGKAQTVTEKEEVQAGDAILELLNKAENARTPEGEIAYQDQLKKRQEEAEKARKAWEAGAQERARKQREEEKKRKEEEDRRRAEEEERRKADEEAAKELAARRAEAKYTGLSQLEKEEEKHHEEIGEQIIRENIHSYGMEFEYLAQNILNGENYNELRRGYNELVQDGPAAIEDGEEKGSGKVLGGLSLDEFRSLMDKEKNFRVSGEDGQPVPAEQNGVINAMYNLLLMEDDGVATRIFDEMEPISKWQHSHVLIRAAMACADGKKLNEEQQRSLEYLRTVMEVSRAYADELTKYQALKEGGQRKSAILQQIEKERLQAEAARYAAAKEQKEFTLVVTDRDFEALAGAIRGKYRDYPDQNILKNRLSECDTEQKRTAYFKELTDRYPAAWEYPTDPEDMLPFEMRNSGSIADLETFGRAHQQELNGLQKAQLLKRLAVLHKVEAIQKKAQEKPYGERDGQTYEVKNDKEGTHIDVPLERQQSSINGCWSCGQHLMLKAKGIDVSQEEIRSYRPPYTEKRMQNKDFRQADSVYRTDNSKDITEMADSVLAFAPDTMMRSFDINNYQRAQNYAERPIDRQAYIESATKIAAEKIKHAIDVDKSPVSFTDGGHYWTITGIDGENITCVDSTDYNAQKGLTISRSHSDKNIRPKHLGTVIKNLLDGNRNAQFVWLSDIELDQDGKHFLNVPSNYLQMKEDGSLQMPPKAVQDDADVQKTQTENNGIRVQLVGGVDDTEYDRMFRNPLTEGNVLVTEQAYIPKQLNAASLKKKASMRTLERSEELKRYNESLFVREKAPVRDDMDLTMQSRRPVLEAPEEIQRNFKDDSMDAQAADRDERTRLKEREQIRYNQEKRRDLNQRVNDFKGDNGYYNLKDEEKVDAQGRKLLIHEPGAIVTFRILMAYQNMMDVLEYLDANHPKSSNPEYYRKKINNLKKEYEKFQEKLNAPENAITDEVRPDIYPVNAYLKKNEDISDGLALLDMLNNAVSVTDFGYIREAYAGAKYNPSAVSRCLENNLYFTDRNLKNNLLKSCAEDKEFYDALRTSLQLPSRNPQVASATSNSNNLVNSYKVFSSAVTTAMATGIHQKAKEEFAAIKQVMADAHAAQTFELMDQYLKNSLGNPAKQAEQPKDSFQQEHDQNEFSLFDKEEKNGEDKKESGKEEGKKEEENEKEENEKKEDEKKEDEKKEDEKKEENEKKEEGKKEEENEKEENEKKEEDEKKEELKTKSVPAGESDKKTTVRTAITFDQLNGRKVEPQNDEKLQGNDKTQNNPVEPQQEPVVQQPGAGAQPDVREQNRTAHNNAVDLTNAIFSAGIEMHLFSNELLLWQDGAGQEYNMICEKARQISRMGVESSPVEFKAQLTELKTMLYQYSEQDADVNDRRENSRRQLVQRLENRITQITPNLDERFRAVDLQPAETLQGLLERKQASKDGTMTGRDKTDAAAEAEVIERYIEDAANYAKNRLVDFDRDLKVNRENDSEHFTAMYDALTALSKLTSRDTPMKLRQCLADLNLASREYQKKIEIKGGGILLTGSSRLAMAGTLAEYTDQKLTFGADIRKLDLNRPVDVQKNANMDRAYEKILDYVVQVQKTQYILKQYAALSANRHNDPGENYERMHNNLQNLSRLGKEVTPNVLVSGMADLLTDTETYLNQYTDNPELRGIRREDRERVRLARELRESLVEQFQKLNIKLAESGLNHGTSLQQQLMEKEHNRYVQMDPDVKIWTNQRASEYIVEVREKVDAAKALQTRMRELNTGNRSEQFRGMVNALQAVCSLNENSTPQQVQEAFMQLDVSSRAYTDKIKLNGEGKGIAGGKRVDLAKECMALTVGYRQLSKKAKMLDVTVGVNQQIERRSMDIADAYAEQQNEQRHKHIAWNDFKSIPGEGNIINNSRRSRSSGNDNNLNNQQHVNNTLGGKKN